MSIIYILVGLYCDLLSWWNNGGSWVNMQWPTWPI